MKTMTDTDIRTKP